MSDTKTSTKKLQLIIFDLDGVLVDTRTIHRDTFIEAYHAHTNKTITPEWHDTNLCGMNSRGKLTRLSTDSDIGNILETKDRLCLAALEKIIPDPEKNLLLSFLKFKGYKLGCFTNCRRINANKILEQLGIAGYFDITIASDEVDRAKPDPEGYLKIMNYFSISPANTLIIEDSPHGIKAAKSSGATVYEVSASDEVNIHLLKRIL